MRSCIDKGETQMNWKEKSEQAVLLLKAAYKNNSDHKYDLVIKWLLKEFNEAQMTGDWT